jgi:hypothetical protein
VLLDELLALLDELETELPALDELLLALEVLLEALLLEGKPPPPPQAAISIPINPTDNPRAITLPMSLSLITYIVSYTTSGTPTSPSPIL